MKYFFICRENFLPTVKNLLVVLLFILTAFFRANAQPDLYGLTNSGGNENEGTIIKYNPGTNNVTVLKGFTGSERNPRYSTFIQASNGKLYGMTSDGGISNEGVIFSYD